MSGRKSLGDRLSGRLAILLLSALGLLLLAAAARDLRTDQPAYATGATGVESRAARNRGEGIEELRERADYFASKLGLGFGVPERARQNAVEAMHESERRLSAVAMSQAAPSAGGPPIRFRPGS